MIDEVKKIKIEELNNQKVQYEEKENTIMQRLKTIRSELWKLEYEQSNGITIRDNFSFLEKWITRRNDYKKFKAQSKRISELPKLISKVKRELVETNTCTNWSTDSNTSTNFGRIRNKCKT